MAWYDGILEGLSNVELEDVLSLLGAYGGYAGWFDTDQQMMGYQGKIPDYTASREQVNYNWDRVPGSAGQRYFTDTIYSETPEDQELPSFEEAQANIDAQKEYLDLYNKGQANKPKFASGGIVSAMGNNRRFSPFIRQLRSRLGGSTVPGLDIARSNAAPQAQSALANISQPEPYNPIARAPQPQPIGPYPYNPIAPAPEPQPIGPAPYNPISPDQPITSSPTYDQPITSSPTYDQTISNYASGGIVSAMETLRGNNPSNTISSAPVPYNPIAPAPQPMPKTGMGNQPAVPPGLAIAQANAAPQGLMGLQQAYKRGPGDGMTDNVPATINGSQPAALTHGEMVIPSDVVSGIGNGNSEAGAEELYNMMDRVRKTRTGTARQAPRINPRQMMPR
jgi:hypothetical protein